MCLAAMAALGMALLVEMVSMLWGLPLLEVAGLGQDVSKPLNSNLFPFYEMFTSFH